MTLPLLTIVLFCSAWIIRSDFDIFACCINYRSRRDEGFLRLGQGPHLPDPVSGPAPLEWSAASDSQLSAGKASHPLRVEKHECKGEMGQGRRGKSYCCKPGELCWTWRITSVMWLTDCKTILLGAVLQYDLTSQKIKVGDTFGNN